MKKLIVLTFILPALFSGCSNEDDVWAKFKIINSNGTTKQITCPGSNGCDQLEKGLDGKLYEEVPRYAEDNEIDDGVLDFTKPIKKPKRLPGNERIKVDPPLLGKSGANPDETCLIIKSGEETIRIKGIIRGQEVDFIRGQEDACEIREYGFWNQIFPTDKTNSNFF